MAKSELKITHLTSASGRVYAINKLIPGEYQYLDRDYRFNYIPSDLNGCLHLKTHGNDKLIAETEACVWFEVDCDIEVFVLFADKFPLLPEWLNHYERTRYNVTREDSRADNLKGYFGLYRKSFAKGLVTLNGCSPRKMLAEDWYVKSNGANYCMYSVAILKKE